ncbi:telomere repeats-binding bouquet formation protein 1 isoform X2 [Echinops telfairi]|uniref:Telomere repeats-binding bouquet formation protein 1 isoform X2 n=1 Tax=Echinops telfairi TaxID=9371 RepID=A0AC55DDR8_ECHTE|nr:telomere repeats-binding bouquet formation protein 1 isoform X2 [Echinops telfairi]
MEPSMERCDTKKIQEMKTDLNLLLECVKHQMDRPVSQKKALIVIHAICQQYSNASAYFQEIGGLLFIRNLAKCNEHSMVKEAALYTMGAIAEQNVYCQETLCTSELFEDLTLFLSDSASNLILKRMSVYVVLVLVSNNRTGQTLIRETGCIQVLTQLFRTVLSTDELNLSDKNIFQLWSGVCSALCACISNPQNEDNQTICCSLFPHANKWLMDCMKPEILRPVCSFISLTLSNNTSVQKHFISVGGLDVLSQVLVKLESDSHKTPPSAKLAVTVIKTVDACTIDNLTFGVILSKYHIVPKLLALLGHEGIDSEDRVSIMLTLSHCMEVCVENQYDFLKNNGFPRVMQFLVESQNEDFNRTATFVLHHCQKFAEKLHLSLEKCFLDENEAEQLSVQEKNREKYRKKAKEILQRITELESEKDKGHIQSEETKDSVSSTKINTQKRLHVDPVGRSAKADHKDKCPSSHTQSSKTPGAMSKACPNEDQMETLLKSANPVNACFRESRKKKTLGQANLSSSQNLCEETSFEKDNFAFPSSDRALRRETLLTQNRKQQVPVVDPFTLCSDIINKEVINFLPTDNCSKMLENRCSGCKAGGKSLNSRNFSKLLHSCPYQCDRHKVIVEAEDRYKSELRKSLICNQKILLTPQRRRLGSDSTVPGGRIMEPNGKTVSIR